MTDKRLEGIEKILATNMKLEFLEREVKMLGVGLKTFTDDNDRTTKNIFLEIKNLESKIL